MQDNDPGLGDVGSRGLRGPTLRFEGPSGTLAKIHVTYTGLGYTTHLDT